MRLGTQYDMKHLKLAGLCLLAMFAMSMVSAGTAQASWEECGTENASKAGSKYTTDECTTASSTGGWAWEPASEAMSVKSKGSLAFRDKKTIAGEVEVECYTEEEGTLDKIEHVKLNSCRAIKLCEAGSVTAEAIDLPWGAATEATEGKVSELVSEEKETEDKPGVKVKCKVAGLSVEDTCKAVGTESLALENKNKGGELLVLATYDKLRKRRALRKTKNRVK